MSELQVGGTPGPLPDGSRRPDPDGPGHDGPVEAGLPARGDVPEGLAAGGQPAAADGRPITAPDRNGDAVRDDGARDDGPYAEGVAPPEKGAGSPLGAVGRALRTTFGRQAWLATIFVAQTAAVATAAFVAVFAVIVASVPLMFVALAGVPLIWLALVLSRAVAVADSWRFQAVLGWRLRLRPAPGSLPPGADPATRPGWFRRAWLRLRSKTSWLELVYVLIVLPVVGWLGSWAVFVFWGGGIAFVLFPAYGHALADGGRVFGMDLGYSGSLLFHLGVGVAALLIAPWLARGTAAAHLALARLLLCPPADEELQARVVDLEASRAGMVAAAAAERRRIERDLHDGAQQRLVAVAMTLGRAQARFDQDPEGARELVAEAHAETKRALAELRDLARGIHPSVLTDRGLDAALSGLAARCPVPVSLDIDVPVRPDVSTESVAYFFVAEALTNVARHAQASQVRVTVHRRGDRLVVEVADDGRGGANEAAGTGIAGLRDRARAVDGTFTITSPPGGGTTLRMELPCRSESRR